MTSWVITIDKGHPQHWAIAKHHSFWDMTKFFPIGLGDTILLLAGRGIDDRPMSSRDVRVPYFAGTPDAVGGQRRAAIPALQP